MMGIDEVFVQLVAPYLGSHGPAGWSYTWLPIEDGDFSFTYYP